MSAELAKFVVVGVGSNVVNFVVYIVAHSAGVPLVGASAIGYLAGLLNSYHFGRTWVFDAKGRAGRLAIVRFAVVYAIGGAGMSAIIEALDRGTSMDYRVSWFFGALFAFTNNFLGSKWLVFQGRASRDGK